MDDKRLLQRRPDLHQTTCSAGWKNLFLVQDDIAIAFKLIDARYEQVIPEEHKRIITVDRMRFIDALR